MKLLILFSFLYLATTCSFSQKNTWIKNDSIKFVVSQTSLKFLPAGIQTPKYVVLVYMSRERLADVKEIKKKEWIDLLSNDSTDWAANLLLYNLYGRDAEKYFISVKSKQDWPFHGQEKKDKKYWRHFIKYTANIPFAHPVVRDVPQGISNCG